MLSQFYNYLAKKIVAYFTEIKVKNGDKFNIQFEKEEEVRSLFEQLKNCSNTEEFVYNAGGEYKTYSLNIEGIKVIVAATIDDVKPDFLTLLRNKVGSTEGEFTNTAILFIHNTTLDSIMGGTISFQREGMPFHIKSIIEDINNQIEHSELTRADKLIMQFDLDRRMSQVHEDNSSLFQYADLLKVINSGGIREEEYKSFGLFYDSKLNDFTISEKDAKGRIKDNAEQFARVDNIHKYGDPEQQLEKYFDDDGVDKLKKPEWEQLKYTEIKQSYENKKQKKNLEYEGYNLFSVDEDDYWEKEEGSGAAKQRIRNIIIFNKHKQNKIKLEYSFDDYLSNKNITIGKNQEATAKTSGKKLLIEIDHEINNVCFNSIKYKDDSSKVKFEFKIVVLDIDKEIIQNDFIKTNYNIFMKRKDNFILLNSENEEIVFNTNGQGKKRQLLSESQEEIFIDSMNEKVIVVNNVEPDETNNYVKFNLNINGVLVPFAVKDEGSKAVVITGQKVWNLKREKKRSFKYVNNKLLFDTKEYFARDEFRDNLNKEKKIIEDGGIYFLELENEIQSQDIQIDTRIKAAYEELIQYYKVNEVLPSTAFYNKELTELAKNYIQTYLEVANEINKGDYIETEEQKNLLKIGTIRKEDGDREIIFTPLHPLNIAYQLKLNEALGIEEVPEELTKKLDSIYLLPYMCSEETRLYKPIEQQHSPEWKYYVDYKIPRYKGSRNFVSKLVKEKVEEFVDHFSYLFELTSKASIKINLVNTGDCKEILQGIIDYYTNKLTKKVKQEDLLPIDINIYSEGDTPNIFEDMTYYDNAIDIEENLGVDFKFNDSSKDYTKEDMLNIYREKVHFYKKSSKNEIYDYCHITFYEMEQYVEEQDSTMDDIKTGVSLEGLISGVPSKFLGDSYRTGFGSKYLKDEEENLLLRLSLKLNSLVKVIQTKSPYEENKCRTTSISEENKSLLDNIYDSSHWVTFIDPKVDLNFFKSDAKAKDLLIIHYSDQYTSSSGYDAITVTRKSKQYEIIINEFLREKGIEAHDKAAIDVINCFNAVNGDWLLRLISSKSQFPREKLSIISAIKLSLAYFYNKNIVWVPISLEEILRVSGGAGLSKSEGVFSVKNLKGDGKYSDDLLLVGLESINDDIRIHYYPVEVKIGHNKNNVIDKAVEQSFKTKEYFEKNLINSEDEDDKKRASKKLYRNFMMQLVLVSAEKMKMYNIWDEQNWELITDSEVRTKLLNDDYTISNELDSYIGRGAVMSFKEGVIFSSEPEMKEFKREKVLVINFSEDEGYRNIISNVETLKEKIINGESDFKKENLLAYKYDQSERVNDYDEAAVEHANNVNEDTDSYEGDKEQEITKEDSNSDTSERKPMQILFGHDALTDKEVIWYPTDTNKTFHTNTGIIGTMGTGKTQFTKSLIYQLHDNDKYNVDGKNIGLLIFDYKGDYIDSEFVKANNAKVYNIYHLPYNPLSLVLTENPKPLLPLHTANTLKETISKAFGLGIKQETLLRDTIMEAYDRRGISKGDMDTWTKMAPTLHDVCRLYLDNEDVKEDSLYAALTNLYEFEIFEPDADKTKPLFDLIEGVTVINLSGYDEGIQNLIVAITLDIFYTQMLTIGESKMKNQYRQLTNLILVDEADNFLSKNFASLKKILKEGRMFGVGTILSTQLLSHFSTGDNEYANYILSWVVHNVSDLNNKDVRFIFNTKNKAEEESIYNKIKSLEKHHSLVKFGHENRPMYIRDKAFWELMKE